MPVAEDFEFAGEPWLWQADQGTAWVFVTVPADISEEIRKVQETLGPRRGFGSVKVEAAIGDTSWRTSVFPDKGSGCFVLPLKKAVRVAEDLDIGEPVGIRLRVGA